MKRKYFKYIFTFFISFICLFYGKVLASTSDYTIQKYDIDMVVNENNTLDITEEITVYFKKERHGIYRKIPLRNRITRLDGTTSSNIAKITNINVSEYYTTSKSNGYTIIHIGEKNETFTGHHTYTIKYTYDIGKDKLKDADELYFNLIGNEWDANIENLNFKITMPKEFNKELLGFSTGYKESTNSDRVRYSVNGNVIQGNTTSTLKEKEGVTIRLTLPEGYFIGVNNKVDLYSIIVIGVCIIMLIIGYALWVKYGKDSVIIETVEFYPPEGYNSAEVGYIYKGKADNKSIISLLIYLANKKYLKIEKIESKKSKVKENFKITKLKEYDGDNLYEKLFFKGLFKRSKKSVTINELYNKFYITLDEIKASMNSKNNRKNIFYIDSDSKSKWIILFIIVIYVLITAKYVLEYNGIRSITSYIFIYSCWFCSICNVSYKKNINYC